MTEPPTNPMWSGSISEASKPLSAGLLRRIIQAVYDAPQRYVIYDQHGIAIGEREYPATPREDAP